MEFSKQDKLDIFENAISWIVVFGMFIYGGAKVVQFDGAAGFDKSVADLTGMELMWAFYGYSKAFAITLGAMEIFGGLLLLFKKTRLFGCLFLSTILMNIIMQDFYFDVHWGALKAALLYQTIIFIILWLHREQVIKSMKSLFLSVQPRTNWQFLLVKLAIAFALFVLLRIGEYWVTIVF